MRPVLIGAIHPWSNIIAGNAGVAAATSFFSTANDRTRNGEHMQPTGDSDDGGRNEQQASSRDVEEVDVAIALGTNIGDRLCNLHAALRRLREVRHRCLARG